MTVNRRRLLQSGGVAALAALAGCLGGDSGNGDDGNGNSDGGNGDDSDGDDGGNGNDNGSENGDGNGAPGVSGVTSYSGYVGADEEGEATTAYIDLTALAGLDSVFDEGAVEESDDPLLLLPITGLTVLTFAGQTLSIAGLGALVDEERDEFTSDIEEWVLSGQALVVAGDIDTGEIDETITADSEGARPGSTYEQVDTTGAYDIYQVPETPDGTRLTDRTIAVSATDIVSAEDRAAVDRVVETVAGSRARATADFDTFEWVLDAAGGHDIAFAGHGETPDSGGEGGSEFSALEEASSFAAGHTFREGETDAEAAAVFESASALEEARPEIEETFGSEADNPSFEFDGDRFSVSATYSGALDAE